MTGSTGLTGYTKATDLDRIKALLSPVFLEKGVKKVMLFGSCAQDSASRRSDLDLMILMETKRRFFDRYEQFEKIYDIIKDRAVDLLIYTPEELEAIAHRPFIRRILDEGQTIYER